MTTLVPFPTQVAGNKVSARPASLSAKSSFVPSNPGQGAGLSAPAGQSPKFGAYIPVFCEVICGVCCLLPVLLIGGLALFGGKKKQPAAPVK